LSLSAFPSLGLLGPCLPWKTCNMVPYDLSYSK
jgi:hypothetical protein